MAIQDDKRNHYFTIPAKWDTNPDLDGMDRYLLMVVNNLSHKRGYCYASYSTLGKLVGLSKRQIKRRFRELERQGAVALDRRKGKISGIRVLP